tara:strand:- start:31 stop:246 length:216 start_codon:yes stop_codon:yes gene_type:complete
MLKRIIFKIDWNLNKFGISIATFIYSDFANIKLFKKKKKLIYFKKFIKVIFGKMTKVLVDMDPLYLGQALI